MQKLRDNPETAEEGFKKILDLNDPGLNPKIKFGPTQIDYKRLTKSSPKVAILRDQGVNSQIEMAVAFNKAGFNAYDIHMTPMHSIYEYGVAGLEPYFKETIPKILKGYLPKQKKSFGKR